MEALQDSGIAGCDCIGSYSLTLARWLLRTWPGKAGLFSIDAPLEEATALLRPILPSAEREAIDLPCTDTAALARTLFGDSVTDQLTGLVRLYDSAIPDDELREALFARLQVFIRMKGDADGFSLTDVRGEPSAAHVHEHGLQRSVDAGAVWNQPLGAPLRLNAEQEMALVRTARIALALMQRETDPITYARAVELFDMGRGLRIALFHLDTEHRLVFESYVGFMAFKNGVPLGYGGAWIFPSRSKVGINVFPAMRGGESAWFFAQLLRLYGQRFRVSFFEAENYQLGHENPDGLKSGAYWFYYRLGFRPWDPGLARIAEVEFGRMKALKGYAVPVRVLRELVADGLLLRMEPESAPVIDTTALLRAVQRHVLHQYRGDRIRATRTATERARASLGGTWKAEELTMLTAWALPLDLIPGWHQWPARDRRRIAAIVRAKAAPTETAHQSLFREHHRLLEALAAAAQSGNA
ncbi:MAG: hypothetical protein IPM46_08090 [Flavobacteriales bacterium]|nr:hypothetical protein [Flavobacteriales bacterium]